MTYLERFKFLFLLIIVLALGCKKSGDSNEEDLSKVPPPTHAQIIKAYEVTTNENPQLINDEPALMQAILRWIKLRPNGELYRIQNPQGDFLFFDLYERLTPEEWALIKQNIFKTIRVYETVDLAQTGAGSQFPCSNESFDHTKRNAIQHSYWNALMTKRVGADFAKKFSDAHEVSPQPVGPNTKMDLHNNQFGIDLAIKYPMAPEAELLLLLVQSKFLFVAPNNEIPTNFNGLVFISGNQQYDVSLTGTLTNPDSGGPWNAVFDFNQCDKLIRGQFTITRGAALQKRRFTGTLGANGVISLTVSDPYQYENPQGLGFCANMLMSLVGNETALSGSWQSTNCNQGGTVSIIK